MKVSQLREKSKKDLLDLLQENQKKMRELRFNLASGKVKNIKTLHETKKDIARILTLLSQA